MEIKAVPLRAKAKGVKKPALASKKCSLVKTTKSLSVFKKPVSSQGKAQKPALKKTQEPIRSMVDLKQLELEKKMKRQVLSEKISRQAHLRSRGPPKLSDWSQKRLKMHQTMATHLSTGFSDLIRAASQSKKKVV